MNVHKIVIEEWWKHCKRHQQNVFSYQGALMTQSDKAWKKKVAARILRWEIEDWARKNLGILGPHYFLSATALTVYFSNVTGLSKQTISFQGTREIGYDFGSQPKKE